MKINKSPWIYQLDKDRKAISIKADTNTDVAIVGAGIAGVSTAFFTLKHTNNRVVLCDQGRLAHGATGHNAGQVVAEFERSLTDIEKEFGFEMTRDGIRAFHSAWVLLDTMYEEAELNIVYSKIQGKTGYSNLYQVLTALQDYEIEIRSGIHEKKFFISETSPFINSIPSIFKNLYKIVPQSFILNAMETKDDSYHALSIDRAACINSALFCQDIVQYLFKKYQDRFSLYENTKIHKIVLRKNNALLDAGKYTIDASRIVLCTNGFENFEIYNEGGLAIDKNFHHLISGSVSYMSGYLENDNKAPTAIAYQDKDYDQAKNEQFFYLTRRPHESGEHNKNLICMGGPEIDIDDRAEYMKDYDYPDEIPAIIDKYIKKEYDLDPDKKINYDFTWHGLMGYTPNRIRLIGEEPKNRVLLYNLGCNGIGILPSIFGGQKIAKIIAGTKFDPSIFDPRMDTIK